MMEDPPVRVDRAVRWGGLLLTVGVAQFVVAMAWVQTQYTGYSWLTNYVSDLGNTVNSPFSPLFNASIVVLGVFVIVGVLLAWAGFPRGGSRVAGLFLLLIAGVGAILVGLYPQDVNTTAHDIASVMVFLPGALALLILAVGMRTGTFWSSYRGFSAILGGVALVSFAYYAPTQLLNTTWDPGLVERLIIFPILLWGFVAGIRLARIPRLSP
jgi:hypothetical membrane protein